MVGAPGAPGSVMGPLTEGDPRRVGPYTTIGRLGVGALGPLYGARSDDGRAVAVRLLRTDLLTDEAVKARLAADTTAARAVPAALAAPVLDADLEAETPWLASAFVPGVPLAKAVADHGPLPEPTLLSLAAGLAEALAALHAAGVMHGDLRPGTVLLTTDGPRIVDHALVRAFDGAVEVGMAGFLAPEQARGRTVTPAADMFALGSTLFFAAMGRPPFGEGDTDEVKKRVAKSSPVLGKLPAALAELIRGCLQKDANGRAQPQQVLEFVRRRAPIPLGSGWLPPAVAADVRAVVAASQEADANATLVVAPSAQPQGAVGFGAGPEVGQGAAGGLGAAHAETGYGAGFQGEAGYGVAGFGAGPAGPIMPQQPTPAAASSPSRRKLLLALGGAVVAVGGGTAVAVGLGGSSGTTTAADVQPSKGPVGAVPPAGGLTGSGAASSASAMPPVERRPLPSAGPLSPAGGAAGALEGPDAAAFWQMPDVGRVDSLAVGEGVLVVAGAAGVSAFDLGSNPKWGPSQDVGVPGSGNGVVAAGVVYLLVTSGQGAAAGGPELLALDLKSGEPKWRIPAPPAAAPGMRVGGVAGDAVFVIGMSGGLPFLWAVNASDGRSLWQTSGVEFATLAVPPTGGQILTAGVPDPNAEGSYAAVNIGTGAQVWTRPLRTSVDYSHVSLSKAAYAGDRYVLLLGAQNGDSLVGGFVDGGQTTWSTAVPEPAGDAGSLAFVTSSPDGKGVVALSRRGVYAADASSGAILWQSQGTQPFNTASDAGAPQFADGNVYLYDQQGTWWAVDFATGRTRWKYSFAAFDQGTEPVWSAVPGGVVIHAGGGLVMIAANG